ncbi:MAG: hypothetical protein WCB14_19905 [Candidatus Acidiferrales bacterium]
MSLAGAIAAVHPAPLSGAGAIGVIHGRPSVIWELVNALLYAAAFYGIHTKAPITWKLGWIALAASFLHFLFRAMSAIQTIPKADHPAVAAVAVLVGAAAVTIYWGLWWNRQKYYFAPRSAKPQIR